MNGPGGNDMNMVAEAEAAERFSLLLSGGATPADRAEIETWRARDDVHDEAWLRVAAIWHGSLEAASDPAIIEMRKNALAAAKPLRAWEGWRPYALAASLALAALGPLWLATSVSGPFSSSGPQIADAGNIPWSTTKRTRVGQIEAMTLADGSVVTMNTDSALSTALSSSARRVRLDRGEAHFKVAKNRKAPFSVYAGDLTVTAVGTSFSVREEGKETIVTLVEGRVRVEAEGLRDAAFLEPGSQLRAGPKGFRIARVDTRLATSWTSGMLDFEESPLGTVVKELNRYTTRHVVLDDPALAAVPVTGVFPAGNQEHFVEMLLANGTARVLRRTETTIELGRP